MKWGAFCTTSRNDCFWLVCVFVCLLTSCWSQLTGSATQHGALGTSLPPVSCGFLARLQIADQNSPEGLDDHCQHSTPLAARKSPNKNFRFFFFRDSNNCQESRGLQSNRRGRRTPQREDPLPCFSAVPQTVHSRSIREADGVHPLSF